MGTGLPGNRDPRVRAESAISRSGGAPAWPSPARGSALLQGSAGIWAQPCSALFHGPRSGCLGVGPAWGSQPHTTDLLEQSNWFLMEGEAVKEAKGITAAQS